MLVTAVSSWVAYDRVRSALESEFEARLKRVAATAARGITPEIVSEVHRLGEEGGGYAEVQVQLVTLRTSTGVTNASLIDSAGVTLVDAGSEEGVERNPAALAPPARRALRDALAGTPSVSGDYRRGGRPLRASFAPIRVSGGPVVGAIAIEAEPTYASVLAALGRTLALIALMSALAIAVLAALIVRAATSSARLERRLSRLENLAAMGRLTATLAHEIKNPLAIIRGSAERLQRLEPEAQRMAGFVIEETDRLSRTVARYLRFARGEEELGETGDAAVALEATLALLEGELAARKVTLERSSTLPSRAPVTLDNESLKQVYLNLILNALEAMPEGGKLRIEASERHGRFEVSIADQGPGVAPDILERMGKPFYTTKAKGSGLGIFLTRRLVRTSGGDLQIQSKVGGGTTCTLRFPRTKG